MEITPKTSALGMREKRLSEGLRSAGLEGVVIAPGPNLTYYTGVRAQLLERPFLLFIPTDGAAHLLVPRFEAGPFRDSIPLVFHSWDDADGPGTAVKELMKAIRARGPWGCDGRVPFGFLHHLLSRGLRVESAEPILQSIREVKEPSEMELIKKSAKILSGAVAKVPGVLREGMTERDLARFIVEGALSAGAEEVSPCMVQSGPRGADPHSETSSRKIGRGDSVVVDVVSSFGGYSADITRTFMLGRDDGFEKTYESVLSAQRKAIAATRAGVEVGEVDAAARDSLNTDGLGKYFIHRTGHGLGLEVHEAPYIVSRGRERLAAGMVFTAEPGVYLPGKLGVRIEDDVVISRKGGADVITSTLPKDYAWWRK